VKTKRCSNCRQAKRVELFDLDPKRSHGRSSYCKDCRRQRQNRNGYAACRNRALRELARRHPGEYDRYREQARLELAPHGAPAEVWAKARGPALAELARRHQAEWNRRFQQLRAAHPTWTHGRVLGVTSTQHRHAHRMELLELLASYAGAKY
jgi:hypothetical protein